MIYSDTLSHNYPSIRHLPISSDKTLYFYRYFKIHVLLAEEQFFLLIYLPIQDREQQLQIPEIFNLPVPPGDISAMYKIIFYILYIISYFTFQPI